MVEGEGEHGWIRVPLTDLISMLDKIFGDLAQLALRYWENEVSPAVSAGVYVGPTSGTNYVTAPVFQDRSVLAMQLFFDAVVTTSNALGRAAAVTRKFYVWSVRFCNIPPLVRSAAAILPIAVVPPTAYDELTWL